MNWLKKIASFFAGIFSQKTADAIMAGIRKAAPYVEVAMQFAGTVATVTGGPAGRTIGTVLAAAEALGVKALIRQDATDAELATALRDIVAQAVKAKFPTASTADLHRAIELAVGAVRQ